MNNSLYLPSCLGSVQQSHIEPECWEIFLGALVESAAGEEPGFWHWKAGFIYKIFILL
jgi:hypothetical protein